LWDDALILEDKKRLKEVVKQDIKVLCKPGKKGATAKNNSLHVLRINVHGGKKCLR